MITQKDRTNLENYIKKRFDEVEMDYKTFDAKAEIDSDLSYAENKAIIEKKLNKILPKIPPKLKKDALIPKEQMEQIYIMETQRAEQQAKLEFEKVLEVIANTPTTFLQEKLYFVPQEYIKMVVHKRVKGLLLYGEPGLGKSFNVKKILSTMKNEKDYVIISGHITPMQFYKKLCSHQDKLIVLDDVNILESTINLNILKSALDTGLVEYSSSVLKDFPSQFIFTGEIIILMNDEPKNNEHLKALESRILTYKMEMDYKTKISILYDIAKHSKDLTESERGDIVEWIKDNTSEATKNLSIRLLNICMEFYKWNKDKWKDLAKSYIKTDEIVNLIVTGISSQEFIEQTGLSRRTYFNYMRKIKDKVYKGSANLK